METERKCKGCHKVLDIGAFPLSKLTGEGNVVPLDKSKSHEVCDSCHSQTSRLRIVIAALLDDVEEASCDLCECAIPHGDEVIINKDMTTCEGCSKKTQLIRKVLDTRGGKTCLSCRDVKPIKEFRITDGVVSLDGLATKCNACIGGYANARGDSLELNAMGKAGVL